MVSIDFALYSGSLQDISYCHRSGGSVVDNTLEYLSKDRKIDPQLSLRFSGNRVSQYRCR